MGDVTLFCLLYLKTLNTAYKLKRCIPINFTHFNSRFDPPHAAVIADSKGHGAGSGSHKSIGKELLADAAILSSVSSPALSSTSVKVVQAAQAVIAPLAQSFEAKTTSLETKVDEVKTLFSDRYDADVLAGQDDAAYSSADRAYFSLMRGLRYLLTHLHKTVKDHADIGDDVTLHLHKVKMAREDVERDDRNKQAKPLWGASPSASNKAL